jgi:peroxin-19
MDLMQEVQEYGQPPSEIIQEIAPGIELDAEGMPKIDGSGLPFPPNEECCIM